jgi:signal transduction histidine kinase
VEVWAYDDRFVSANPAAPPFPPELRAVLEKGTSPADSVARVDGRRILQVAVRMGWTGGPCAIVLGRQEARNDQIAVHDLVAGSLLVGAGLLVAVLLASGPVVARIRRLDARVRRAAAERWSAPIEVEGNDEVADLARAFEAAGAEVRTRIEELERRERTLREFVANTDHDLMIPLTVLQGHLADLRRRAEAGEKADPARVQEAAEEAHYMASLVRNLGVAARLEAGEPSPSREPVDLNALVERVVARHRPVAGPRNIAVEFAVPERPVVTEGDETLLEQAVGNLVHNAVRHNRPGGHVAVTLEEPKDAPGRFVLRVADDGPGVPEAELAHLGERGHRAAEARQRSPGGRGLGLHIARTVAERHGMVLSLRNREGGGLEAELRKG